MGSRGQVGLLSDKVEEMMEKFTIISNKVDGLTTVIHHINSCILSLSPQEWSRNIEKSVVDIKRELSEFSNDLLTKAAHGRVDCSRKLQQRKFCFYQAHRNASLATINEQALTEAIPKIPRKIFQNPSSQQDPTQEALRKELCLKEVEHEIRRLRTVAEIKTNYLCKIDNDIFEMITKKYTGNEAETESKKWKELIKKEEDISKEIWKKKGEFFSSEKHLISLESQSKPGTRNFQNKPNVLLPNRNRPMNRRRFENRNFTDFNYNPNIRRPRFNRFNNAPRSSNINYGRPNERNWQQNRQRNFFGGNSNRSNLWELPVEDCVDFNEDGNLNDQHNSNSFLD